MSQLNAQHLGHTVKDRITGATGVAIGYVQYLTGCHQMLVAPTTVKDDAPPTSWWVDVQRVVLVPDTPVLVLDNTLTPGADLAPTRSTPPVR